MSSTEESSSPAEGTITAFFYGTLMVPQIFFRVTHATEKPSAELSSRYTFTPALLRDFSRRKVHYADYPAIVPQQGHTVLGCLATGLTPSDVSNLNAYESNMYSRDECTVQLLAHDALNHDGSPNKDVIDLAMKDFDEGKAEQVKTHVYVWSDPISDLEESEWLYEEFRKSKMKNWIYGNHEEFRDATAVQKKINEVEVVDLTDDKPEGDGKKDDVEESETEDVRTKRLASVIAGIARGEEAEAELDGKKVDPEEVKAKLDDKELEVLASAV